MALKLGKGVYELEREMPAFELKEWMGLSRLRRAEQKKEWRGWWN